MPADNTHEEKRHFSRIPMDSTAHLRCGGSEWPTQLIDISLKGALFTHPQQWQGVIGDACTLEILLGEGEDVIHMEGCVAHAEAGRIGFRCDHIGLDSISHLKRLVELNLGDERLLERELAELIG